MSRSYAKLLVSTWQDTNFLALSVPAQRMYLFLISQPDLNGCGVIPLRTRRWASSARGYNPQRVEADLAELEASRFIIQDPECEELLVRSFMRRDGVENNRNLRVKALRDVELTHSPLLRGELAKELERMGLRKSHQESHQEGLPISDSENVGVVVGVVDGVTTGTASARARARVPTRDDLARFDDFWAVYPVRKGKQPAVRAWAQAVERADPDTIITGAEIYAKYLETARQPPSPKWAQGWLNDSRWDDEYDDLTDRPAIQEIGTFE